MARIPRRPDAGLPKPTPAERAAKRDLLTEIDRLGWFVRGSLLKVANRCGNPTCRCQEDPASRHGPYWQWSRKVAGKTVSVRLNDGQAELVAVWIANSKLVDQRLAELAELSGQVAERILSAVGK